MKHYSYVIKDITEMQDILSSSNITSLLNKHAILVQIYSANTDVKKIEQITHLISNRMPKAVIVGATTVGEVIFGKTYTNSIVIGFSFFESSSVELIAKDCENGQEFSIGKSMVQEIEKIDGKIAGVLLLSTPLSLDAKALLNGLETSTLDYKLFGGGAGDYASMENSLVFTSQWISSKGAVAVIFKGKDLYIDSRTYLGWRPLSKEMTITQAQGMLVKTIDNKPAFDIYQHYLGFDKDENFFKSVLEFPLLITRQGEEIARVPVFVDDNGAIQFVADVQEGETFRIAYGNPELIISDAKQMHKYVHTFQPQATFLYTCGCRRFLMQENVELETAPFENSAPTFGFYTYGEFFGTLANTSLLNSTMVIVSMREGEAEHKNEVSETILALNDESDDPYANKHGRIISRLVHFVEAVTDDLAKKNLELERLSITDGLTGIYNRRHFNELFPKIINSAKRKNEIVAFLIMDIDHFKQYNDIYGHQMGDKTLIKVATSIKESLFRADDYCFRLGGEEFGVIFKTDSKQKAKQFANKIRENIENLHIEHKDNSASKYVTASMGLICKNANDIKDEGEVYKQADNLLYQAKESGRNKVL